jgi:hypothetical protein
MRTIAAIAVLTIATALLSPATAGSQSDATGTLHFVNLDGASVDVWVGDDKEVSKLAVGNGADVEAEPGSHTLRLCAAGSTEPTPGPGCIAIGTAKKISLESGQNRTVAFTPSWTVATNDQEPTPPGKARYTLHNPGQVPTEMSVCIDGELVAQAGAFQSDAAEVDAGDDQAVDYFLLEPGAFTTCTQGSPFASATHDLAAGTNLVDTYAPFTVPACTDACVQVLPVGEDPAAPSSEPSPADFCAVVPQIQTIQFALEALFVGVEAGRSSTFPSRDRIESVTEPIRGVLDAGDATVPADVRDAYLEETDLARAVLAAVAAADDDLEEIPEQDLSELVERIEEPPPPTKESRARQAALSEWFAASCTLEMPEIAFTG